MHAQGIIQYHGLVKDVREILARIHCTIHPTYYPEGLSNVLLESCASMRPVITTDRAGCREAVDNGVNGYLIRQEDSADLISKMEQFLALPHEEKKKMGQMGRQKMEREFDRRLVVDTYLRTIEEVAKYG